MPSLTRPIDAEWAMAQDLTEATGVACSANEPDVTGGSAVAHVVQTGCSPETAVSWRHQLSIDVWAGSTPDYAEATDKALAIAGAVATMALRSPSSERQWISPDVNNIYPNPDPDHPGVPRVTVTCSAAIRGEKIY
jgi:hypothetical protein